MGKRTQFLHWTLFACLVAAGAYLAVENGWWGRVERDSTHITLITLSVFTLSTLWLGRLSWRIGSPHDGKGYRLLRHSLGHGHFAASACVTIGLIGTVIGYYLTSQLTTGGENASEVMASNIKAGMGTYLINTAVGGICGFLVEIQTHFGLMATERAMLEAGIPLEEDAS